MKSFIIGGIPLFLFLFGMLFYTEIVVGIAIASALIFTAYLIGEAIREEFGDKRD